jgi:hypothetical protein
VAAVAEAARRLWLATASASTLRQTADGGQPVRHKVWWQQSPTHRSHFSLSLPPSLTLASFKDLFC